MLRDQLEWAYSQRFALKRDYAWALKREYVREPAGTSEGGQFATTAKQAFLQAFDPAKKETWYRKGEGWHRSPEGEKGYADAQSRSDDPTYVPPPVTHTVIRGPNVGWWGGSHHGSTVITGEAARQMGLEGWKDWGATEESMEVATRMLTAIAEDEVGSEEPLYHSFQNTRGTVFKEGDTMRLPLVAAAGEPRTIYATRAEWENQEGPPTVLVFPKGTPMVGYLKPTKADAKELGHATVEDVYKESGHIWDEAIVAGKFRVVKVETRYMGSQHSNTPIAKGQTPQLYGQVVHLEPVETYDPKTGKWVARG